MEYTEHQQSLLRKLEQLQKDEGLSLSALSARLGISKGALSQLFSGSYQANPQKMFAKLESYFGVKDQTRQTYQESGYADTSISTEIYDIIGVCEIKGGLAIAAGDAGIGKTKAAQHFVAEHPNNSVLITLNPCLTSIKSLLRLIADRIGAPMERSRDALWYSIRQKLSDGTVLIFDESQHLPLKTIEVLRSFSDDFADHGQTSGILNKIFQPILDKLPSLIFAILFLLIGFFLVKQIMRILKRAFNRSNMDGIMSSFIRSVAKIVLYVLLIVIALSILDVPMDSIVAVIASAGVAVGLALKDSLSNLAGGFIILFSKPLKEGDTIEADGVTGKVEAITILYTRIVTADNKTVFIPNGVVASGKIINYTDKDTRRVDLNFGISYEDDIDAARKVLLEQVQAAPEALAEPEAKVVVFSHDDSAVVLQLQVWTKSENYWQLHYRLLEDVKKAFDSHGISIPYPQMDVHMPEETTDSNS